jgi:predicted amidohydrolase YtcJ
MKTILYNGKVYIERGIFAQAVLIEDGLIVATGSDEDIFAAGGIGCEKYDCEGRTVVPGFNDSHMHAVSFGEHMASVNITGTSSIDDVVERCKRFIAENPKTCKNGIASRGWNQDFFTSGEKRYLYRHDLDRISTDIPIVLTRVCGHILAANTKAIEMAGLGPNSPQIAGGLFERGDDGFPNGFFAENACEYMYSVIPAHSVEEIETFTLKALAYALSHGLTSIQSNDVGACGLGVVGTFDLIHKIYAENENLPRYHHQMLFASVEEFKAFLGPDGERGNGSCDERHTLGPLKLLRDGSLGARTAAVRTAYLDDPGNFGIEAMSVELADAYCSLAAQNGMQVITHAIGDDAIQKTLDAYERIIGGENKLRHSIVHYQCVDEEIIRRTAKLGVIAQVQPVFLTTDLHAIPTRFSPEMNRWFLCFKHMHDMGVKLSFGSDCPIEDCNPFISIYCAVTRQDVFGWPEGGFHPEECLDVATAVDLFTCGSAYAQFQENVKGRIKPGMYADIVVLDTDIFTCEKEKIKDTLPVMTMVGGKAM